MRKTQFDLPESDVQFLRDLILRGETHDKASKLMSEHLGRRVSRWMIGHLCGKYAIQTQRKGPRSGPGHKHSWRGGRVIDKDGYVLIYCPDHPECLEANAIRQAQAKPGKRWRKRSYVREHRLVMENHLGRYLLPEEVVHHVNGDHQDNRIENLEVFQSNAEHLRQTLKGKCPNWTPEGYQRMCSPRKAPQPEPHQVAA